LAQAKVQTQFGTAFFPAKCNQVHNIASIHRLFIGIDIAGKRTRVNQVAFMTNHENTEIAGSSPAKCTKNYLRMTKLFLPAFIGILLLTGFARHYNISLTNNHTIPTTSKPKVNKAGDAFVFKDRTGKLMALPKGSVKQIEPQSSRPSEEPIFKPK